MHVRDIHTSHLLTHIKAVYSVVQQTMLPRSGNKDVMIEVDQMVMYCLMTKRRINLVRLILDYILAVVDATRRSHVILPYGMFLTRAFTRPNFALKDIRLIVHSPQQPQKRSQPWGWNLKALRRKKKRKRRKKRRRKIRGRKIPLSRRMLPLRKLSLSLLMRKRRRKRDKKEVSHQSQKRGEKARKERWNLQKKPLPHPMQKMRYLSLLPRLWMLLHQQDLQADPPNQEKEVSWSGNQFLNYNKSKKVKQRLFNFMSKID